MMLQTSKLILFLSVVFLATGYESPLEEKDFRRLLKQNKNVLVLCAKNDASAKPTLQLFKLIEPDIKGRGLLIYVDCEKGKKLCKKFKLDTNNAELKHFKDGEFHKVYDRSLTVKSLINFMLDPTGDLPWDEEEVARDVLHLNSAKDFERALKKPLPMLVMFYAPWCGYCKRLKPVYAEAATEVRGQYLLAGLNMDRVENQPLRRVFNITGFPTIIYFEKGEEKFRYSGGHTKDDIINWLKNPHAPEESSEETDEDSFFPTDSENVNYIVHLNDSTFDAFITENAQAPILAMFYAPWCGHCKNLKPELIQASIDLHNEGSDAIIAAIDATGSPLLSKQYKIEGFPTMKFFRDGKFAFNIQERSGEKIAAFLRDPKQPPPPEPEWSEQESDVLHLTEDNFKTTLKKKKSALVMFYAPWCGHCKKAKPLYTNAAAKWKENPKIAYAAVDCTKSQLICTDFEIQGYPTIKYFSFGKFVAEYPNERTEEAFTNFMNNPEEQLDKAKSAPAATDPIQFWKDSAPGYEHVHMLQSSTFDAVIGSSQKALVMFYAPWCGHCKNSKPAFASAAAKIAVTYKNIILGAVDATVDQDLVSKYEIKGFPTFKYFENGQLSGDYSGDRSEQDFVQFLTGSTGNVEL